MPKKEKISDCDLLIGCTESTFRELRNCLGDVASDKKTKMNVVGSMFKFGISLSKLTFSTVGCIVKNTPKAVVAIAAVKREIVADLEDEYNKFQKQAKEDALNEKISQLKLKR